MRRIVLDTETTGFEYSGPDRICEIACVELDGTRITGNTFQRYVNPGVRVAPGALKVHGLNNDFLADKPDFSDILEELLDFLGRDAIIGHNYLAFDRHFVNKEMRLAGKPELDNEGIDTLIMARIRHRGVSNTLDALVRRYNIKNTRGAHHGALVDAELNARVYCHMVQTEAAPVLDLGPKTEPVETGVEFPPTVVVQATPDELNLHAAMCNELGLKLWQRHQHPQK